MGRTGLRFLCSLAVALTLCAAHAARATATGAGSDSVIVWVLPSGVDTFEDTLPPDTAAPPPQLAAQLAGMQGETLSFQIALRLAGGAPDVNVTLVSTGLRNTASSARAGVVTPDTVTATPGSNAHDNAHENGRTGDTGGDGAISIQWHQVGFVYCSADVVYTQSRGPGWYPDPLLPPMESGAGVVAGVTTTLWVSVDVPSSAAAGAYSGRVDVVTERGVTVSTVSVGLEVWPIALPPLNQSAFAGLFSFDDISFAAQSEATMHAYWDFMAAHRMPADILYLHTPRKWAAYARLLAQGARWLNIGCLDEVAGKRQLLYTDAEIAARLTVLAPAVDWFTQRGALDRAYVYGFDEADISFLPAMTQLFGAVKARWPALRVVSVLNWPGLNNTHDPRGSRQPVPPSLPVDVWVTEFRTYDNPNTSSYVAAWKATATAAEGMPTAHRKEVLQYFCCCYDVATCLNNFIEWPRALNRAMAWLAAGRGAPGLLYYAMNEWRAANPNPCGGAGQPRCHYHNRTVARLHATTGRTNFDPDVSGRSNGQGFFLYPGGGGAPVSSVRLEALRQGLQDWELLQLWVRATGVAPPLPLSSEVIRSPGDRSLEDAAFDGARRRAARDIMRALRLRARSARGAGDRDVVAGQE